MTRGDRVSSTPSNMPRRRRLGRRGTFLLLFSGIYVAAGVGTLVADANRFDLLPVIGPALDTPWWGLMWLAAAVVAAVVALARPRRGDGAGFVALLVPPGLWSLFYLASLTAWLVSGGELGRLTAITGAAAWSVAWSVVLLVSGWPDPDPGDPPSPVSDQKGG